MVHLRLQQVVMHLNFKSSIGNRVKAKVVKNKVAPPFRQAEFDIMFGEGISFVGELIDYGVKMDIVDKSGAWFSYGSEKLGQGKENAKVTIKEVFKYKYISKWSSGFTPL